MNACRLTGDAPRTMPLRPAAHTFLTHTFSECVENHAGMETIGRKRKHGFTEAHLASASTRLGAELHSLKVIPHVSRLPTLR